MRNKAYSSTTKVQTIKRCFLLYDLEVPNRTLFITAEAKNMIYLNRFLLNVKVGICKEDGKTRAKVNEHPVVFSNNALHTLFTQADLYLNGKLIAHSNNC